MLTMIISKFLSESSKLRPTQHFVNEGQKVLNNSLLQWLNETVAHGFCIFLLTSRSNFYLAMRNWIVLYERIP